MMASSFSTDARTARRAMVASQLRTSAVSDVRVQAAMAEVPREAFVGAADAETAYRDRPIPLGGGREQNAPLVTGRLLTEAAVQPSDRVLLIGAAGGYTAALLAELAASVVAVEVDAALFASARAALPASVTLVEGPLITGAPGHAPFDLLVIDGAVEQLPQALIDQVRVGGRVVAGIIEQGVTRLASGVRTAGNEKGVGFTLEPFADMDCVTLPGFERARAFHFPG